MKLDKARLLLAQAQGEHRYDAAMRLLNQALDLTVTSNPSENNGASTSLGARVLAEIAITKLDPRTRVRAWLAAIHLLEKLIDGNKGHPEIVGHYADIVVDASQDPYAEFYDVIVRGRLARARRCLQELTGTDCQLPPQQHAYLLTRLSAVRRAQAITQLAFVERRRVFLEALAIVNRALAIQPDGSTVQLELANCYWALSRYAESDGQYTTELGKAERAFLSACHSGDLEVADISLARFYRLTHQATHACDEFVRLVGRTHQRRRLFRESHILAEAVQHLWYTGYPDTHVRPLMAEAIELLTAAIDSGCLYARHIVDLGMLHAMQGDATLADTILTRELLTKNQRFDWNTIVSTITSSEFLDAPTKDLPGLGFALGLNSPVILNKLGTYCRDFLANRELALTFYDASLRLDRRSSMALTNKARLLLDRGDSKDFKEVRALLDRAKNYADRRYTWWRHELNRLILARGGTLEAPNREESKEGALFSFRHRRLAFHRIAAILDPNQRGLEFERFIADLIAVSFTEYAGSHRSPGAQNDAFFVHRQNPFRVEVKWTSAVVPPPVLREFASRIEVAKMSGLFVSMSGFADSAVQYARSIIRQRCLLLVDGDDIRSVVEGDVSFLDLVDFKYLTFYKEENPYTKFKRRAPG